MAMVWYEIKKILVRPSCQIAMLLLVILAASSCFQVFSGDMANFIQWVNEKGEKETGIAASRKLRDAQEEWSGVLDQQLLEEALEELKRINADSVKMSENVDNQGDYAYSQYQKLNVIRNLLNQSFKSNYEWKYEDYFIAETLDPEQLSSFYKNRIDQLKEWLYDESSSGYTKFTDEEKQYLINCYEALETPFAVGYTSGWDMAYEASASTILWGSIILAFLVSGIFAGEFRWKADSVYFSTVHGKKKGITAKLVSGFTLTTVCYWIILVAVNLLILSCLGFEGATCPIQANSNWWKSIYNITFLQRTLFGLIDGYWCWLFIAALVMLVSALSRSFTISVTVPSLLILIPRFLENNNVSSFVSDLLKLMPHKMLSAYGNASITLFTICGNVTTPITIQRFLYPCLTLIFALACSWVYKRKQIR